MLIKKMALKTLIGLLLVTPLWAQNTKDAKDPQAAPVAVPATSGVLSFLEWKSQRVHEAQQKVEQMNSKGQNPAFAEGKSASEVTQSADNQKLNFNVDVALQLNIQDYFSMYLKNLSQDDFKEATKKMSGEDVAELLMAYKAALEKEKKLPLKFSKVPQNNAKSKNPEI